MIDFESGFQIPTPIYKLEESIFQEKGLEVFVKRDDLTHPFLSGNKFRKLKYNLIEAKHLGYKKMLTFGGAYSNHLSAFAYACKYFGFEALILVRGDELTPESSPTLLFATAQGAALKFVSRAAYRNKTVLAEPYTEEYYIVPEGGSNQLAIKGVGEMVLELDDFDYILTAMGTGGTFAGILQASPLNHQVIGIPVLKNGSFLKEEVEQLLMSDLPENGKIFTSYHFNGYAKYTDELIQFIRNFEHKYPVRLEQVYTGKMFYAFYDLLKQDYFKTGSRIILVHTGGMQGRLSWL